jgi:glycine/sarcosine N-methyltransferase
MNEDRTWSRAQFRSVVAWPSRIRREEPFLLPLLERAPERSLLDLGCGTGEHSRHFAAKGWRVTGVDASADTIETAVREAGGAGANPVFVVADLRESDRLPGAPFGAALCLGNTLPFLTAPDDLERTFAALHRALHPGGVLVAQILNYEGLRARKVRHLPLNFQKEEGESEELVFLRLLDFPDPRTVLFFPTTLRLSPEDAERPVELLRTHRIVLRTWTRHDLEPALEAAGFEEVKVYGTMEGGAFDPATSPDLVVSARRKNR